MNYLTATSDEQLGMCLRMLLAYTEKPIYEVETLKNSQDKIEFHVYIDADEEEYARLKQRYELFIA